MVISEKEYVFIPLFRSVLFKSCEFKTNSNDVQDLIIVKALNIKDRKRRIAFVYDSACSYVDNYYNNENICGFRNCQCYAQRGSDLKNGCCRKCLHVTDVGCPTKNLACKLFNCSEVYCRRKTVTYNDLKLLKVLSLRQRFIVRSDYFSLREDVLKDLYSYSIIYSTIRIIYRLLRGFIKKNMIK